MWLLNEPVLWHSLSPFKIDIKWCLDPDNTAHGWKYRSLNENELLFNNVFSAALSLLELKGKKKKKNSQKNVFECGLPSRDHLSISCWSLLLGANGTGIGNQGSDGVDGSVSWSQAGLGLWTMRPWWDEGKPGVQVHLSFYFGNSVWILGAGLNSI